MVSDMSDIDVEFCRCVHLELLGACQTTGLYPIARSIAFGSPYPQPTEWQRIGNQIDAAPIASIHLHHQTISSRGQ